MGLVRYNIWHNRQLQFGKFVQQLVPIVTEEGLFQVHLGLTGANKIVLSMLLLELQVLAVGIRYSAL